MRRTDRREQAILAAMFARMDPVALAAGVGALGAVGVFCATAWLLIQGAPAGHPVGPHLALLNTYLPGYAVSWPGALLGVLYGAMIGGIIGLFIAVLWNFTHRLYLLVVTSGRQTFIE